MTFTRDRLFKANTYLQPVQGIASTGSNHRSFDSRNSGCESQAVRASTYCVAALIELRWRSTDKAVIADCRLIGRPINQPDSH